MIDILFINFYSAAIVIIVFVFFFLLRQPQKKTTLKVLTFLTGVMFFWTLLEFTSSFKFFSHSTQLFLWRSVFFLFSIVIFGVFLSVLTLVFKKFRSWVGRTALVSVFVFGYLFYFFCFTEEVIREVLWGSAKWWSLVYIKGDWFEVAAIVMSSLLFLSVVLLLGKILQTTSKTSKKRLSYFLTGLLFLVVFGGGVNLSIPLLTEKQIPIISSLTGALLALSLYYAVYKFGFFGGGGRNTSIKTKLILTFMAVVFLSGTAGALVFQGTLGEITDIQVSNYLKFAVTEKSARVDDLLKEQKDRVRYIASSNHIKEELSRATTTGEQSQLSISFRENPVKSNVFDHFNNISIFNKYGEIVDSIDDNDPDKSIIENIDPFKGEEGVQIEEFPKEGFFIIFKPVRSNSGEFLGVVVSKVETEKLNKIISEGKKISEMEEFYLVNKKGYLLAFSGDKKEVDANRRIDTLNTEKCFDSQTQGRYISVFRDHSGEKVLGANSRAAEANWCVLGESNYDQLLSFYKTIARDYYLLYLLVLFGAAFISGYLFSYSISLPILKLKKETKKAKENNFDYKVKLKNRDEIGDLAKEFNNTVKEVYNSRQEINKKVDEQTRQIEEKMEDLEKMNKLMVGREIKMKELKKENEKLKEKLKSKNNSS